MVEILLSISLHKRQNYEYLLLFSWLKRIKILNAANIFKDDMKLNTPFYSTVLTEITFPFAVKTRRTGGEKRRHKIINNGIDMQISSLY
jgi:hypothetical protein